MMESMKDMMQHPFSKSVPTAARCSKLHDVVHLDDRLAIVINADPDALASALALRRIFWRKAKDTAIYHINTIERPDNLSMIRLLDIGTRPIQELKPSKYTKWALLDSQPAHHDLLKKFQFDIIIDHHSLTEGLSAAYLDIRQHYGANSTLLTEYLKAEKIKPSPRLATALFYGIKTDTDNFVRTSNARDINAFKYLYKFSNMNIVKKIESSEMTLKTLGSYKTAMESLTIIQHKAIINMGDVKDADTLVLIADFFLKLAEATWCMVFGVLDQKLIIIFRNAGFRRDAGKLAKQLFDEFGNAGGHRGAARAEIPLENIADKIKKAGGYGRFVINRINSKAPAV
jgi:nanoRNase/pAp phosphatase (c-di-AMP/oligoRNAs hydrolase)